MNELFNGNHNSDSDTELTINKNYAHSYNSWRQKEELNKLKTKYGEHIKDNDTSGEDSSTSEDEDEDGNELTETFEKNFYKTLSLLKNKDPCIYDEKVTFFDDNDGSEAKGKEENKKNSKEKPLFLRDYERKVMIERDGKFSDSEDEENLEQETTQSLAPTYVEEQRKLKESFKKILDADDDDDKFLLKPKSKTEEDEKQEEEAYKVWLKGQQTEIDSKEKEELKPLRDFWTDPKLDRNEKFLRDYVLNKKFLDNESTDLDPDYELIAHDSDENLSEDEKNIETQEEFEHKFNFRFEEPDQEFIKRYPRTLENSMRRKDTRRAEKRVEVKKRKEEEAIRKREELKQLKALKRKEIEAKIEKLKEITGNDDIRFDEVDLDGDFDPAEHDRKMQAMFNDDFYAGPEGDMKPEFPEIDQELEVETTWDKYDPEQDQLGNETEHNDGPHCDDPDFNMDDDYDASKTLREELIDSTKKKKRRRRNKLAVAIAKEKPKFDPSSNPSYQAYLDQYYALDYEDMIGDQPCRFKYRNVIANDYGLTVDEIIAADDKELNKWCSLKKALQHRPEHLELNDVRTYRQKAQNEALKKKIFKSIYGQREETQHQEEIAGPSDQQDRDVPKKKRKRGKRKNIREQKSPAEKVGADSSGNQIESKARSGQFENGSNKRKRKITNGGEGAVQENETPLKTAKIEKVLRDKKPKKKKVKKDKVEENLSLGEFECKDIKIEDANQVSAKMDVSDGSKNEAGTKISTQAKKKTLKNRNRKNKITHNKVTEDKNNLITNLSEERLRAYGINPKKFKNRLKYGNKNKN